MATSRWATWLRHPASILPSLVLVFLLAFLFPSSYPTLPGLPVTTPFLFAVLSLLVFLIATALASLLLWPILVIYRARNVSFWDNAASLAPSFAVALLAWTAATAAKASSSLAVLLAIVLGGAVAAGALDTLYRPKKSALYMSLAILLLYGYIAESGSWDVLIVYLLLLAIIFYFRKKFAPNGIVLFHKTRFGLRFIERMARFRSTHRVIGFLAVVVGYLGMLAISGYLLYNLYEVLLQAAAPGISPVVPGVQVPGSPITLPLWYGIISIFLVALIHEFSHGIIARLYRLRVRHTGILMLGPFIGGAFVDLDERQLERAKPYKQLAVMAAGPFSNLLTALAVFLIATLLFNPFLSGLAAPAGAMIGVTPGSPAAHAGLVDNLVIVAIGNRTITGPQDVLSAMNGTHPNETVQLTVVNATDPYYAGPLFAKNVSVTLGSDPANASKPHMGVLMYPYSRFTHSALATYGKVLLELFLIVQTFLLWFFVISLGIGIANLLPIGPVDGGRMLLVALQSFLKKERAIYIWERVTVFFILVIALILFSPLFHALGLF